MSTLEAYESELAEVLKALSENLRRLREDKLPNLSQEEVASEAKLHRTEWGKVEQGKRDPRFSTMLVMAETLGITLNDLAEGISAPKERKPSPPTAKRQSA
jgi:transcriptional regulator with XRE-family HTH domain